MRLEAERNGEEVVGAGGRGWRRRREREEEGREKGERKVWSF